MPKDTVRLAVTIAWFCFVGLGVTWMLHGNYTDDDEERRDGILLLAITLLVEESSWPKE